LIGLENDIAPSFKESFNMLEAIMNVERTERGGELLNEAAEDNWRQRSRKCIGECRVGILENCEKMG